jgi:hypothetical protein
MLMARIAASESKVAEFSTEKSRDRTAWVNYLFTAGKADPIWKTLHSRVLHHRQWGNLLRKSSIVTVEGTRGWDNYLLLHHFDSTRILDKLDGV